VHASDVHACTKHVQASLSISNTALKCSDTIKVWNGIIVDFYPGQPHTQVIIHRHRSRRSG